MNKANVRVGGCRDFLVGFVILLIAGFILLPSLASCSNSDDKTIDYGKLSSEEDTLVILSSYENKSMESTVQEYAKDKLDKEVYFKYMGDLDIVDELNSNSKNYDAVWISNSMWLYMLDNSYLTSDSKSLGISPIVFGIRKSKAKKLGLIGKDVSNTDIVNLITNKKIKYVMNSVTQTNTGATAYLSFTSALAGNPEVLTEKMLKNEKLQNKLINLFSGVERVSGDESYLEEMFLNDDSYEAVVDSESSLIELNQKLKSKNKEELYLIYPSDGVGINDSTFAYLDNGRDKEDSFLNVQKYLLSEEGQNALLAKGYRTWYGGVSDTADKNVFNPDWGIDTTKYLTVTKAPSKSVITKALNIYIEELRKPTHVVFVLDYSGSMYGSGFDQLYSAMKYILTYADASKDKLQFSEKDKITLVPFSDSVGASFDAESGIDTSSLITDMKDYEIGGTTALYDGIIEALDILKDESSKYTTTVIAMTDGEVNVGTFSQLKKYYNKYNLKIPVYSIMFGDSNRKQLDQIANLTNAKVFDGKTNLLEAFKEVRGYN